MFTMPTTHTRKLGLRASGSGIHDAANRARLRAVGSWNFHKRAARPSQLVPKHQDKLAPARVKYAAVQAFLVSTSLGRYRSNVQLLDHDHAVALGVVVGDLMQNVRSLSRNLAVKLGNPKSGFLLVTRSFLSSGYDSLSTSYAKPHDSQEMRISDNLSVAVRHEVYASAIEGNNGSCSGLRCLFLDFTRDRGKPLIGLASNRASLGLSLKLSVSNDAHVAEFRKAENGVVFQLPHFRMGLTETGLITSLAFPFWSQREKGETTLPCLIQFDEKLSTNISRNIGQPRKLGAKLSQFIDLIEARDILPIASSPIKTDQSLLQGNVPQEAQSVFPSRQSEDLLLCRIDTEAKRLVENHYFNDKLVCAITQGNSNRPACRLRVVRSLGLRSQVSTSDNQSEGLRNSKDRLGRGLQGLRVRIAGEQFRTRSRSSDGVIPHKSESLKIGQFAQGSQLSPLASRKAPRNSKEALGRSLLVSLLLRSFLWWGTSRHHSKIHSITTTDRLLLALKDEVSA